MRITLHLSQWLVSAVRPNKHPLEWIKYKLGERKVRLRLKEFGWILKAYREQDLIAKLDYEKLELKRQKILNGTRGPKD